MLISARGDGRKCDFCGSPWGNRLAVKEYGARSFSLDVGTEKIDSLGNWRACGFCSELIDAGKWDELVERAVAIYASESDMPVAVIRGYVSTYFRMFRENRIESPIRVDKRELLASTVSRLITAKALPRDALTIEKPDNPSYSPEVKIDGKPLPSNPTTDPMVPPKKIILDGKAAYRQSHKEDDKVLVKIQNVHDYFVEHWREHHWNDVKKFSAVRMPFHNIIFSYESTFETRDGIPVNRHMDLDVLEINPEALMRLLPEMRLTVEAGHELSRFIEEAAPYRAIGVKIYSDTKPWPGHWIVTIDEYGQVLHRGEFGYIYLRNPRETELLKNVPEFRGKSGDDVVTEIFSKHSCLALAALQFMNCRNVEVVDNAPRAKHVRRAIERGERPPVSYKTLLIHPMHRRRSAAARTGGDPSGAGVALHIVRGHFKDYRNGAGLGRAHRKGLWWWSPQVRGTNAERRVEKDYEVVER